MSAGSVSDRPPADQHRSRCGPGWPSPGLREHRARRPVEQPGAGRRAQRGQRPRGPQRGQPRAVLQLQQLDGPLDVGEPAAAELGVQGRVGAARQPLGLDPRLDPADLAHVRVGQPALRVAQRVDQRDEPLAAARRRRRPARPAAAPGLPDQRPALVVGGVRRERAHQRARCGPRAAGRRRRRSGGSAPGSASSRRSSPDHRVRGRPSRPARRRPGSGSCTNSTSASLP